MTPTLPGTLQRLPLVGRSEELAALAGGFERARAGLGSAVLILGDAGAGKSRLMAAAAEDAKRHGWQIVAGRAYPVETEIPYAIFSDAFVPFLQGLDPAARSLLARGSEDWLSRLFSALRPASAGGIDEPAEANSRVQLFWNFARFLKALSDRQPLLVVLDDLHAADVSSIELFHFLARQLEDARVAFVATGLASEWEKRAPLRAMQQSLGSLDLLTTVTVEPLTSECTHDLVRQLFGADPSVTREFTALLYGWTRGNPFFIEETLKGLVESGRLRREGSSWLGWEISELRLPPSVRDAVLQRLSALSQPARDVAEVAAVFGSRVRWSELRVSAALPEDVIVDAVDELRRANVLDESEQGREVTYDFRHPMLRETLLGELGLVRRRTIHRRIAEALEQLHGDASLDHAEELAAHFVRAGDIPQAARVARYLAAAGRRALSRSANREAADYLRAALERIPTDADQDDDLLDRFPLMVDLARAHQRLGSFEEALTLLDEAHAVAAARADHAGVALALRRVGLSHLFSGQPQRALAALDVAAEAGERSGQGDLLCRVHLARSACLLAVGESAAARAALEMALAAGERSGDAALLARVYRGLLLFHTVCGPPDAARAHGDHAIELARSASDLAVAGSCHWAMAVLEGLNARAVDCARHMEAARQLADTLGSPLLHLAIEEIAVQYSYSLGDWDTGIALGERAIALARVLNQGAILPRLLVWTALIYVGRDEMERAKGYLDEAWSLAGAGSSAVDVLSAVTVHVGLAQYHLTQEQYQRAVAVGERGLAIADRTGYRAWAVHRLLPTIAEAHLRRADFEGARRVSERLRDDATALQHRLGLAWAATCDAVLTWLQGGSPAAVDEMRRAAEALEEAPFVHDAARVRRQLAGRLADVGDRDGALRELRLVHDVFLRLGAVRELEKSRVQFHELGARPPVRAAGSGSEGLTGRELEIIRLVAGDLSNKAIAKALAISARTVATHLSNIFKKLNVDSREELARYARTTLLA